MPPMTLDAPEPADSPVAHAIPRRYAALGVIVLAILLVAVLIVVRNHVNQANGTSDVETMTPAPASLITSVSHVPASIASAVGVTSPDAPTTPPTATGNTSLWQSSAAGARPVVFFYGAEFAPYAAAERWPVVVALSRFGTFSALGLMQSASSVGFSDTATFTFWQARYSSIWVDLQEVERYSSLNPTGGGFLPLQTPTARQAASVAVYDSSTTTFPLLDIANHYVLVGSSFTPSVLEGLSQSDVAADLLIPASPVAQAILASANEITAAICTVTGQRPAAVCGAHGVDLADAKMDIHKA